MVKLHVPLLALTIATSSALAFYPQPGDRINILHRRDLDQEFAREYLLGARDTTYDDLEERTLREIVKSLSKDKHPPKQETPKQEPLTSILTVAQSEQPRPSGKNIGWKEEEPKDLVDKTKKRKLPLWKFWKSRLPPPRPRPVGERNAVKIARREARDGKRKDKSTRELTLARILFESGATPARLQSRSLP